MDTEAEYSKEQLIAWIRTLKQECKRLRGQLHTVAGPAPASMLNSPAKLHSYDRTVQSVILSKHAPIALKNRIEYIPGCLGTLYDIPAFVDVKREYITDNMKNTIALLQMSDGTTIQVMEEKRDDNTSPRRGKQEQ